jgi:uncharacterized protein
MKYLLVVLVVMAGLWWWTSQRRRQRSSRSVPPPPSAAPGQTPGAARPHTMLACAHCGVHLPAPEAERDGAGLPYCGSHHRQLGPRSAPPPSSR